MPDSASAPDLKVLLPLPLGEPLTYAGIRDSGAAPPVPGQLVRVPLGSRQLLGVVWDGAPAVLPPGAKLKPVADVLNLPPLAAPLRRLVDWVAQYTVSPPGAVLRMCLPMPEALTEPAPTRTSLFAADGPGPWRETPQRLRVLALAREQPGLGPGDLAALAAVTPAVVRGLVQAGALRAEAVPTDRPRPEPGAGIAGPGLSAEQAAAAGELAAAVRQRQFAVTLLEGVTGSGKTEVYFEAVAEALRLGRQCLVLLPEIALTQTWLDRFEQRFGGQAWAWHSDLTPARRAETLRAVMHGRARVVVGARSALFLPYTDLGLIVIDEEHDPSYKQEEGTIYNARDMAVVRARYEGIPIVLASATPSLETLLNVRRGRYRHVLLTERHGAAMLPGLQVIDLRRHDPPGQRFISGPLQAAMARVLAEGEQCLLFLNRRGYAPLTLCGACGHRLQCPNCTAWLVEHKSRGRLLCHHCGFQSRMPQACTACGAEGRFRACGPGVERLAEEASSLFPDARVAMITSDTMNSPRQIADLLARVERHEIDILIGTQIVAKGHHFPLLTLVGVIDADLGLAGGDPRASERTWQLLTQVSGRAGRAERPGQVLLQSYNPEHPVIAALARHDGAGFVAAEMAERERSQMPPFGRLAAVIASGPDAAALAIVTRQLAASAPQGPGIRVLGPAPAPLSFLRGRHRERFLLKSDRNTDVSAMMRQWVAGVKPRGGIKIAVDIDPYSFL